MLPESIVIACQPVAVIARSDSIFYVVLSLRESFRLWVSVSGAKSDVMNGLFAVFNHIKREEVTNSSLHYMHSLCMLYIQ